jgi:hypothetical protein
VCYKEGFLVFVGLSESFALSLKEPYEVKLSAIKEEMTLHGKVP